jgi:hypothetical protein
MEIESDSVIPFLDVLMIREEMTEVYRKPTHTGRYLNFNSNRPPHVKKGSVQSLHKRASTICQECQDLDSEIGSLRYDGVPGVGLQLMTPVYEQVQTVHALDNEDTVFS